MATVTNREAHAETPWLTSWQAGCDMLRGGRAKCMGIKGELRFYNPRFEMACTNGASYQSLPSPTTVGEIRPTYSEQVRQSVGTVWLQFRGV